ncbi:kynurenine formamidase [Anaerobacterium chartisolvens]|uniref:Kynurenine formamidase n=1 Tax=Anaerobacterium chartisolvens TaxID=1297424 RepID=A0A369BHG4_9FIRM|nr:cyclase family protein [Anaerobacterium chartisolvens]RCX21002.1 kynurenine formamidase [Anaerobacterium chartisolvens]
MKIKKIIDVSRRIYPGMAVWPGDSPVEIEINSSIEKGDACNVSSIKMGLHTGTHIDAPFHFINGGKRISSLNLSHYIGTVKVFDLKVQGFIDKSSISPLPIFEGDTVFLKTRNSLLHQTEPFCKDFIYIEESAAAYLAEKKIKTLGVDYLSIDGYSSSGYLSDGHPAHHLLLSNEIGIIEGLYLKDVQEGEYFFSCLPLSIEDADGSPVRAVLFETE